MSSISLADRLVAHRGYAARYPENTLRAVREALAVGARFIEIDIQLSADRVPVLYHDPDLRRLSGDDADIHRLTRAQLAERRCPYPQRFGERFADEPVATLAQLSGLMQGCPQVLFFIELKLEALEHFGAGPVLAAIEPLLQPCQRQSVLISYDLGVLERAGRRGRN